MGNYNQAPKFVSKVDKRKVPMNALIFTMVFAVAAFMSSQVGAGTVYLFLTSIIGISNVIVYVLYAVCLIIYRKRVLPSQGRTVDDLKFKVPLYPVLPVVLITLCVILFVGMIFDPTQRMALITGVPTYIAFYVGSVLYSKKKQS
jgi:amino acid permease